MVANDQITEQNQTTYVLVHGAWHGSWCCKRVRKSLRDAGHQAFTPTLTGLGERSHLNSAAVNLSTHIADVVNLLRWENLSDVILCGHSYGGNVISGVADRIPERIRAPVYLDAFVPEGGECLFDLHSPELAQQLRLQAQTAGDGWNVPPIPAGRFNVCSLGKHPMYIPINRVVRRAHKTESGAVSHAHAAHILGTGWDNSPFRAAHERAKAKGWETRTVTCGHEVMLDLPDELTDLLLEFVTAPSPLVA